MSSQLIKLSRIAAAIALFLGIVHETYTFGFVSTVKQLHASWQELVLYMYLPTGLACLLAGATMLLASSRSVQNWSLSNHIYFISATFMLVLGIGAPIAMSDNPFGYISLVGGVFSVAVGVLRYRQSMS